MAEARFPLLTLAWVLAAGSLSPASAGVRLGAISMCTGYDYPVYPGYDSPFLYGPFYDPLYSSAIDYPCFASPVFLVPQADKGRVSLQAPSKDAEVYLNNAYAGTAADLKKFWLAPGVYELEVRSNDQITKKKRIYVLTGKNLKVSLE
jgi:hypothetical protein